MPESLEPHTLEPDFDASHLIAEAVARGDLSPDPSPEALGTVASILRAHYAEQEAGGILHCATCHKPFPAEQTNLLHGYHFCSKPCRNEYRHWATWSQQLPMPESLGRRSSGEAANEHRRLMSRPAPSPDR